MKFKNVVWNLAGLFAGIIIAVIVNVVSHYVFFDLIPKIPIIPSFLSWPVSYDWYAMTGVILVTFGASFGVANVLCGHAKSRIKYGVTVLLVLGAIYFVITLISHLTTNGFSWPALTIYGFAIITCIVFLFESLASGSSS